MSAARLKFFTSKIGSGKTPRGGSAVYRQSGVMLLRSQNVHFGGLRLSDVVYISLEIDSEMANSRVQDCDVLLNITGASLGRCAVVPANFPPANVNQHVSIVRVDRSHLKPEFLAYLLPGNEIQARIWADENGSSREGLTFQQIGNFPVIILELLQQNAIANYLDKETSEIAALVAEKERMLALLEEKRAALISRAVTRGMNPKAPTKPSGLNWLGDIPQHWEIERAKNLFAIRDERSEQGDEELLTVSHITGVTSRSEKDVNMFKADDMSGYKKCRNDDFVTNTLWAWMGAMGISPLDGIVSPDYHVYTSKGQLLPEFMKLRTISLANFRGFEHVDFDFEHDVNVIAGENGIGKSSILCALATLLSHALRVITPAKIGELQFSDSDVRFGSESLLVSAKIEVTGKELYFSSSRSLENKEKTAAVVQELNERLNELQKIEGGNKRDREKEQARIQRNIGALKRSLTESEDQNSLIVGGLEVSPSIGDPDAQTKAEKAFFGALLKREGQPIAVYYTTKRFFNDGFKSIPKSPPFSVSRAYSNALEDLDVSLKDFAHWFHFASENEKGVRVTNRMTEVVSEFIPEFQNLRLAEEGPIRFLVDKGGVTLPLKSLSDGERGLVAMVFDLTRRLSLANPMSEDPIGEGEAIVLIDEIELHLHPIWQREVLRRLESTFKNCQFIAATHSPQVIGEIPAKCVKLLSRREGKVIVETPAMAFGADSNWILNVLMGSDEQSEKVKEGLTEISHLIADKNLDTAAEKIYALRQTVGNTESIQRLASTIDRIRLLGK